MPPTTTTRASGKEAVPKPSQKEKTIRAFEKKAKVARLYSAVCAVWAAAFLLLHCTHVLPVPLLDSGDTFAEPGSVEFTLVMFFIAMHVAVLVLLRSPLSAQCAAVGVAMCLCASIGYILIFCAIHLSNLLELQGPNHGAPDPAAPKEGSGLAMAGNYFASLKAQEEAAKYAANGGENRPHRREPPAPVNMADVFFLVISSLSDVVTSLVNPANWPNRAEDAAQPHAPLYYLARPEMLLVSVVGFLWSCLTIFSVEEFAVAAGHKPTNAARKSNLTADALRQHASAQTATPAAPAAKDGAEDSKKNQ